MPLIRKSLSRVFALLLIVVAGPALGGGDWKMGPFGPYWDDNSWPEFTPMYWMEEFMNRLDDDDDEIQAWMLRNQFPGQSSGTWPGTGVQGLYPQGGLQPDDWTGSRAQVTRRPDTAPYRNAPAGNTYIFGENSALSDEDEGESGPLPYLTPEEFARMPVDLQREYKRAFDEEYPIVSKPRSGNEQRRPLPNLTPQEYSRMPVELQREYKQAFEREYSKTSRQPLSRERPSLPNLTPEEFSRMPAELQQDYRREFEREYSEYQARRDRLLRQRKSYPEGRQ